MPPHPTQAQHQWITAWLDSVAEGRSAMSQRRVTSIEKHAGSLRNLATAARKRGVHLLLLEDDKGNALVAASVKPFKVLA